MMVQKVDDNDDDSDKDSIFQFKNVYCHIVTYTHIYHTKII